MINMSFQARYSREDLSVMGEHRPQSSSTRLDLVLDTEEAEEYLTGENVEVNLSRKFNEWIVSLEEQGVRSPTLSQQRKYGLPVTIALSIPNPLPNPPEAVGDKKEGKAQNPAQVRILESLRETALPYHRRDDGKGVVM